MSDSAAEQTQRAVEEIVHAITRFLKDRLGRGPQGYRTYLVEDMIVIRFLNTLTSAEIEMSKTSDGPRSIKDIHARLVAELRPSLEDLLTRSIAAELISIHSDLSTRTAEWLVILVLDRKVRDINGEGKRRRAT